MHSHTATSPLDMIDVAGHALPNRLLVAPMTRVSAHPDGVPSPAMADYYEAFARGGFAMIITEGTYTDDAHSQGYLNQPGLTREAHEIGWRTIVDRVHDHGARIVLQLMHAGALSQSNTAGQESIAPSAVQPRGRKMTEYGGEGPFAMPREMTGDDISQVVAGFAAAASRARDAGFDGVEVHAANGYLLDQFLTTYTNSRADGYGGTVANRARLTAEVVHAIRAATGPHFMIGVRLSQTKINDFTYRWPGGAAEAETIFTTVTAADPDYLHLASEGRDWWETARLDEHHTVTSLARSCTGLPVVANGGMHDLDQMTRVLDGHADLLSFARGALANPDLPRRIANGQELRPFDHRILQPEATLVNSLRVAAELTAS